jgi:EAL domain-containing protein (putative c-di-GMP-specific phosphodiesterase class I)
MEACRTAVSWPSDLKISVNLSPVQFTATDLYNTVKSALETSGLEPHRLELEITERLFLEDTQKNSANPPPAERARHSHRHG